MGGRAYGLRPSVAAALAPGRVATEMCVCVAALSLALVMAGTGDVATLRILRSLRRRADRGVSYGACLTRKSPVLFNILSKTPDLLCIGC